MLTGQLDPLLMALLIAAFLLILTTLMPWLLSATSSRARVVREETVEVVGCTTCDYESVRRYEKGDYVGKAVGTCPKDGSSLVVKAIYVERFTGGK